MWPFSRKPRDMATLPKLSDDSHEWSVAMAEHDGEPLIVRCNTTAKNWNAHPELPPKLGFAIPLNNVNKGGLPDPNENEALNDVEDAIVEEIESRTVGIQVLAMTTGQMKEFIFYIPEGVDIKSIHESLQKKIKSHEVQCIAAMESN